LKPVSSWYYPVPRINKETFRKELMRLVDIGVLTPVQQSKWGTPAFIIPEKDGTVHFITEYRKVNRISKRKPYPIPRITDTLQQLKSFPYASAIELAEYAMANNIQSVPVFSGWVNKVTIQTRDCMIGKVKTKYC
jgi:hypothetical protein